MGNIQICTVDTEDNVHFRKADFYTSALLLWQPWAITKRLQPPQVILSDTRHGSNVGILLETLFSVDFA